MAVVLDKLRKMNHGYIYIILFALVFIPLVRPLGLGIGIGRLEGLAYQYIQTVPAGSKVLFYTNIAQWTTGTFSPLTSLIEHLLRRDAKILFVPHGAETPSQIVRAMNFVPSGKGLTYGEDWIILQIIPDNEANHAFFAQNIPGSSPTDGLNRKPISTYSIMVGINTVKDVVMAVAQEEEGGIYLRQVAGPFHVPSIMVHGTDKIPTHSTWLEAGLIVGAVDGIPCAAAYEVMLGLPGEAARQMDILSLTAVYGLILLFICNADTLVKHVQARNLKSSSVKGVN